MNKELKKLIKESEDYQNKNSVFIQITKKKGDDLKLFIAGGGIPSLIAVDALIDRLSHTSEKSYDETLEAILEIRRTREELEIEAKEHDSWSDF